jgi:protein-disulfide isomerase
MLKRIAILTLCAVVGAPMVVFAQGITTQQADEILKELRAIRQLLQQPPAAGAPPRAGIRPAGPQPDQKVKVMATGYAMGKMDAPLTLVEFTDLECPFCSRFHATTFEEIKKNYIDTGKVRYVTRDYPLPFHANAVKAANAARCAADQGKFWEFRSALIKNATKLGGDNILQYARDMRLNDKELSACLEKMTYDKDVQKDIEDAGKVGVSGTPTFVLGLTTLGEMDGVKIVGALPFEVFDTKIKELLAPKK